MRVNIREQIFERITATVKTTTTIATTSTTTTTSTKATATGRTGKKQHVFNTVKTT